MLIIYFLLGLGITTAHSDYGVSYRAQNFDKTVQNIDKEAYIKHQREKRFVTGNVPTQNLNKPTSGNLNITRNHKTFTGPSNNSRNTVANGQQFVNPGQNYNTNVTWPVYPTYNYIKVRPGYNINGNNNTSNASGYTVPVNSVTPRNTAYPGYPAPNTGYSVPNTGYSAPNTGYPAQNTVYPAPNTGYPASNTNSGQNYNSNTTRPVYPNYNNIIVRPTNTTNFNNSYPSGYSVQPVNPARPGITPYPGYPGYPAPNTSYTVPNTGYPAPNTGYPTQNTVSPAPNTGYPASSGYPNNGYSAQSGYPVPNTLYPPPSSVIPPANVTGFVPKPNPGFTIHDAVPRNNTNGYNNTATWENCKCKLPRANSIITKEERTMDACSIVCGDCPAGMKMSAFGMCVKDLDDDEE